MTDTALRVLIVDDNDAEAEQTAWMLETSAEATAFALERSVTVDRAVDTARQHRADVLLLDIATGGDDPMDTFVRVSTQVPETPIVVLTSAENAGHATEVVRLGAQDYLLKGSAHAHELARTLRFAVQRHRMLTARQEIFAQISHELRTPLFAILGHAEILLEPEFPLDDHEEIKEFARTIKMTSQQLLAQVNEVLDLSKLVAGNLELFLEEIELRGMLDELATSMSPLARGRQQVLEVDVPDGVDKIRADRNRVRQIMLNLMSNAVKYTPEGGRITLGARNNGSSVHVFVRDTGIGIRKEAQDHVFDPYYQVKGVAAQRVYASTGLGLALTKRLVEMQGGKIWLDSEPGAGSTFAFSMPVAR